MLAACAYANAMAILPLLLWPAATHRFDARHIVLFRWLNRHRFDRKNAKQ